MIKNSTVIDNYRHVDEHIGILILKIFAKIDILRSLRKSVPTDTLKLLYNAIVLPHFDYSDSVYDTGTETNKTKLITTD